jgi:heptosyltransferase-1
MSNSPRILIIRMSSLGDILHALPALSSLRASFPDAKIDWLGAHKSKSLLAAIPGIDSLHLLDTRDLLRFPPDRLAWRRLGHLIRTLRAQQYDFSIDFQGLLKTAILSALSGSKARLGFSGALVRERPAHWFYNKTLDRPVTPAHVIVLNQLLAELTGAHSIHPFTHDFIVSENDSEYVDSLLKQLQFEDFIVINPGGGWPTKRWSPEKFGTLSQRIRAKLGLSVIVTTGPGEESLYQTIAANSGSFIPHHFPVSFLQLIPLLQKARLLVGGDTGPFHLACALGTAVVGIFGPTSTIRNGPWRKEDEVVTYNLSCSPCHGRTCSQNNECMDIAVDEVFHAILRRLNTQSKEAQIALP